MARRNRDPGREAKREKMSNLPPELKESSMGDIHDLFKEMIRTFLEGELDEELGYIKYDYKHIAIDFYCDLPYLRGGILYEKNNSFIFKHYNNFVFDSI